MSMSMSMSRSSGRRSFDSVTLELELELDPFFSPSACSPQSASQRCQGACLAPISVEDELSS